MQPSLPVAALNYGPSSRGHVASSVLECGGVTACQQSTALTGARYWLQHPTILATSFTDYTSGTFDIFVRTINCIGERELTRPLTVYAEQDGDSFIARTREFGQIYGVGESPGDAFGDFELCLADLFEDLRDMSAPYSTEWEQVRAHLSELAGE